MSSLPENTTYKNLSAAVQPMMKAVKNLSATMPSKKSVDVSQYNNLAGKVNGVRSSGQSPSTLGLGTVTTPYGGSTRYEKFHPGIDIANKMGTKIPSYTPGRVTAVVGGTHQGSKGYGNYVIVTDPEGNKHRYSHLNNAFVKIGDQINKGSVIGGMGNTGQTYSVSGGDASHLDYRIRDLYGKYVNPLKYINS